MLDGGYLKDKSKSRLEFSTDNACRVRCKAVDKAREVTSYDDLLLVFI